MALVLGRKEGEAVRLIVPPSDEPTEIVVTLARISPHLVKVATEAPGAVKILRAELEEDWSKR